MSHLPVSVIVVSRGRPEALQRCLTGLSQQTYQQFEVIVVSDPEGLDALKDLAFRDYLKRIDYSEANISKARNLGIAEAAGEVVAFIDDDAVPEPTWLTHLTAPFADDTVAAAGGYVRGRNGITFQWQAQSVDQTGETQSLTIDEVRPTVLTPTPDRAIKTEGTNMAFRRYLLAEMGGFDPGFRFFLDETDVNLRIAGMGLCTAIVPLAEVHHGYLASDWRSGDRVPRDLTELGASLAVFLRKHCASDRHAEVWARFQASQRKRLLEHMVAGRMEPHDVRVLLAGLRNGFDKGLARQVGSLPRIPRASKGFRGFPAGEKTGSAVVAGRLWNRRRNWQDARRLAKTNKTVSLFLFSRTGLFHRVRFQDGIWVQTGGLFGRSDRRQRMFRIVGFNRRLREEKRRVAEQRGLVTD